MILARSHDSQKDDLIEQIGPFIGRLFHLDDVGIIKLERMLDNDLLRWIFSIVAIVIIFIIFLLSCIVFNSK